MYTNFNNDLKHIAILKAQTILAVKSSDVLGPYRHIGLTPKAEFQGMNQEVAEVDDPRSFTGIPAKRIAKKVVPAFGFDLNEINMENLALAHLAAVDEYTQAATPVAAEPLGETGNRGVAVGSIFRLANRNIDTTETVTIETDEVTPIAFDEYDPSDGSGHYKLHALAGLVEIVAIPATATAGDPIRASYTPTAIVTGAGMKRIKAATETRVEGRLILLGESSEGAKIMVTIWNCYIEADGGYPFVTEDPAKLSLKVTVLSDGVHDEPYEILELAPAA